ncbi:MAG: MarC family protein [Gemmatimonadota bacterium]
MRAQPHLGRKAGSTIASAFILLFLVIDPLGNIPFFLAALKAVPPARQRVVVARELVIALAIMVVFLFAGRPLLSLLRISQPALTISGGVVLFLIAIRMVFPDRHRADDLIAGEPFIVPLAVPYVAGPSVLATEMLLMSRDPARWPTWLAAVVLAWMATALILMSGQRLGRVLGERGMVAIERLMGMVLVAVAVQMFLSGLDEYFA